MQYIILAISLLVVGAFLTLFVKENQKMKVCSILTLISAGMALFPVSYVLFHGKELKSIIKASMIIGDNVLIMDTLSAIFVLIIALMCFLGVIYANGYIKPYLGKNKNVASHCFFLMILIASMYMVTISQSGLLFLISWEIMSLSSFFLVLFEGEKKEVRKASIKYLVYMHLSVIFLIAMFAILSINTASFDFGQFSELLSNNQHLANVIFILGFIGFGIKAGFVPFHNWLPEAHPAAPSHVSGIMSGVMIKTGIYGILRLICLIGTPTKFISYFVLTVSLLTILYIISI